MNEDEACIFCKNDFPDPHQLVSEAPSSWLFIHNKRPQTDFHCLVILKRKAMERAGLDHISDIGEFDGSDASNDILTELGKVLNKASRAIKACHQDIERVLLVSLNAGRGSKHLHFHLIPKWRGEFIKTLFSPERCSTSLLGGSYEYSRFQSGQ